MSAQTVTRKVAPLITFDAKPKAALVDVTPAQAKKWLGEHNTKNRPIRERVVSAYARDMVSDSWQVTGDAIKFATDGTLLDGQHRLAAVIEAGVPVQLFVIRNLANEAQEVMDSGVKRQASDALSLRGYSHVNNLAGVARLAMTVETYGYEAVLGRNYAFTTTEITAFIEDHPEVADYANIGNQTARQLDASPTVVIYSMWRLHAIDADEANDFFAACRDGIGLEAGDPVLALRRRLAEARRHRERVSMATHLSLIFRAWNARREDKVVQRLQVSNRNGDIVIPEPV